MIVFVDHRGVVHNFRYAFFNEEEGPMPPRDCGVYILLDRNGVGCDDLGTHGVLYVGQSETGGLRNRMFFHAEDPEYADRYRALGRWPRDVLFVTDADVEIAARGEASLLARRTAYEDLLHGLFVPPCSDQFPETKERGAAEGCVPTVSLDLEAGSLKWAGFKAIQSVE